MRQSLLLPRNVLCPACAPLTCSPWVLPQKHMHRIHTLLSYVWWLMYKAHRPWMSKGSQPRPRVCLCAIQWIVTMVNFTVALPEMKHFIVWFQKQQLAINSETCETCHFQVTIQVSSLLVAKTTKHSLAYKRSSVMHLFFLAGNLERNNSPHLASTLRTFEVLWVPFMNAISLFNIKHFSE